MTVTWESTETFAHVVTSEAEIDPEAAPLVDNASYLIDLGVLTITN